MTGAGVRGDGVADPCDGLSGDGKVAGGGDNHAGYKTTVHVGYMGVVGYWWHINSLWKVCRRVRFAHHGLEFIGQSVNRSLAIGCMIIRSNA